MTIASHIPSTHEPAGSCDAAARVTKSLLGYGVLAGPLYVTVSLSQALTRDGFDLARHQWSMLALGEHGWIQLLNFVLTGLMLVAAAVGMRRALRPGRGAVWGPRLIGAYGVSMVAAGAFRADPAFGFPAGTPQGPGTISWHGMLHLAAGAIGFACLGAACFVLASRFGSQRRGLAVASRIVGIAFLAGFAVVASGAGSAAANVAFIVAVIAVLAWLAAVSIHLYRRA